jgi:1-acyl-sn-glycerol-3-phosphate acyltransferase
VTELLPALYLLVPLLILLWLVLRGWRASEVDWGGRWTNVIDGWFRLFCKGYHRLQYEPLQLPPSGPAIVVCNHVSGLDPFLMIAATDRPLHFLIATEQYHRFGLTWLFKRAGCIPVDRERRPEKALKHALGALENGAVVALFPHGTIHLDSDAPRKLKRGVARLASLTSAPVYPMRLEGVKGEGHIVRGLIRRGHPHMTTYPPLYCQKDNERAFLEQLAALLEGRDKE